MSRVEGWVWTVLILAVMLAIPPRVYRSMLLALVVLVMLPMALLLFL
jgi:hypothetical protein